MTLSSTDINEIVRGLQDTGWDEAVITVGDVTIALARNGASLASVPSAAPAPVAVPTPAVEPVSSDTVTQNPAATTPQAPTPPPSSPAERRADDVVVSAKSVGIFWESPEPGAAPYVKVGDTVQEESVVCIVEIMKLMNHVHAGVNGVVTEILVENGQAVQLGTPLFVIRQEA